MNRKIIYLGCMVILMIALVGCGAEKESTTGHDVTDIEENEKENVEDDFVDEEQSIVNEDDTVAEVERLQEAFIEAMQDYSGEEWYALVPDKDISNLAHASTEEELQGSMDELRKVVETVYGGKAQYSYVRTSFEELDVEKLKNAIQDDESVDIVETLNKGIKYIIESGCNLQRCIKSDMEITIDNGQKNSVQTGSSFVYEIDGRWYIQGPFYEVYSEQKKQVESNDEDEDEDDWDEDSDSSDYSSLLLS